jgi:hypothetical protein
MAVGGAWSSGKGGSATSWPSAFIGCGSERLGTGRAIFGKVFGSHVTGGAIGAFIVVE